MGTPAPPAAPTIEFRPWVEGSQFDGRALDYLDFVLSLTGRHPSEAGLYDRFASIGLGAGLFDLEALDDARRQAIEAGVADGRAELETFVEEVVKDPLGSAKLFGTRDHLERSAREDFGAHDFWMLRMTAAHLGLYGNSGQEAVYPTYRFDAEGQPLNADQRRYTLTFPKGHLPPVKAFWSLTMYDGQTQLLIENALDRYLLNSTMLEQFTFGDDGSLTLVVQRDHPGMELESNWLPAPDGPFYTVLRLYGPRDEVLTGRWRHPPLVNRGPVAS